MNIEDIKEAIEVLEDASAEMLMETGDKDYYREAIAILRQAIEQAQQAGQAQPVAWCDMAYANLGAVRDKMPLEQVTAVQDWLEKVYTTPPKRKPWVGLTAEEIWQCNTAPAGHHVECHICVAHQNVLDFAEAIEAKLKEKNA